MPKTYTIVLVKCQCTLTVILNVPACDETLTSTLQAKLHGNEPSKGAKIDAEIQAEEEEELRRKGKA